MNHWKSYLELCKPKVVALILMTAYIGMLLSSSELIPLQTSLLAILGIACAASAAAVINHLVDQSIDALMKRTHKRPLPTGTINSKQALLFAFALSCISMLILWYFVNPLTALLTFVTLIGYAFIYSVFLKHTTPQNIVIGGITGATPPLLGWTAITGQIDPEAWLLVLIIFSWTPPHFWALSIHRCEEYRKANVPMLPVTHGIRFTKLCVTLYTILLIPISILPFVFGMSSYLYLIGALILGLSFLYHSLLLQFTNLPYAAIKTFKFSISYLFILFLILLIDHYLY